MVAVARELAPGIHVRPTTREDRGALQAHFEALSAEDLGLRFFSEELPSGYVDAWLGLPEDGGECFIVTRRGPAGAEVCVGEAGYVPRGDGTAEFAFSVAADARGGVGGRLLAFLREVAAARGIGALYADVLAHNGAMNHLLLRRGSVTVERAAGEVAGVILATAPGAPPWPSDEGASPRILVESEDGTWEGEDVLREAGYQVAVCPGPRARPAADPCPMLVGRRCDLADGADIVVHDLSPDLPVHRQLVERLEAPSEHLPVLRRSAGSVKVDADEVVARLGARGSRQADRQGP